MSGICGVIRLDGRPTLSSELNPIMSAMSFRGPDGTTVWDDGVAALGFAKFATTPESVHEHLPLTDQLSGCTILADARIDNRDELIPLLAPDRQTIGDGELILLAYLRWGEDCPAHLLGDFAFAIWDERERRLFAARDPLETRPFYYSTRPGGSFIFASDESGVLAHPAVRREVNEGRIADLFNDMECFEPSSTWSVDVSRLEPGHLLKFDSKGLFTGQWYSLPDVGECKLASEQDYLDAFIAVFQLAVQSRLRTVGPVGSMLSGGLDSGSICAIASALLSACDQGPLRTFSVVGPDDTSCIETASIFASAAKLKNIEPHFIDYTAIDDQGSLAQASLLPSNPFDAHMSLPRATFHAAREAGVRVVLDGSVADVVLTPHRMITRMLRRGEWIAALREALANKDSGLWVGSILAELLSASVQAWAPDWIRTTRRNLLWAWTDHRPRWSRPLSDEFAKRLALRERWQKFRDREQKFAAMQSDARTFLEFPPYLSIGRERYARVAAEAGVESRAPFCDLRLINFLRSLPPRMLRRDGWSKYCLRRAMIDRLPYSVVWRRERTHLGLALSTRLILAQVDAARTLKPIRDFFEPNLVDPSSGQIQSWLPTQDRVSLHVLGNWTRERDVLN